MICTLSTRQDKDAGSGMGTNGYAVLLKKHSSTSATLLLYRMHCTSVDNVAQIRIARVRMRSKVSASPLRALAFRRTSAGASAVHKAIFTVPINFFPTQKSFIFIPPFMLNVIEYKTADLSTMIRVHCVTFSVHHCIEKLILQLFRGNFKVFENWYI